MHKLTWVYGMHTPTVVLVNMSKRTVFTKGLKWVWGSNDSGEWPQGLTGCCGLCHFPLTPLVTSRHIKKSFYTQGDIQRPTYTPSHSLTHIAYTHQCFTPIKMVVWQSSE